LLLKPELKRLKPRSYHRLSKHKAFHRPNVVALTISQTTSLERGKMVSDQVATRVNITVGHMRALSAVHQSTQCQHHPHSTVVLLPSAPHPHRSSSLSCPLTNSTTGSKELATQSLNADPTDQIAAPQDPLAAMTTAGRGGRSQSAAAKTEDGGTSQMTITQGESKRTTVRE